MPLHLRGFLTLAAMGLLVWPLLQMGSLAVVGLLEVHDTPAPADAVVVFAGGGGDRVRHGARLVELGFAPRLLILGTGPEMECAESILGPWTPAAGAQLIFPTEPLRSTDDSARATCTLAARYGWRRVIVVSHEWHMRRIELALGRHRRTCPLLVTLRCPPPTARLAHDWWRDGPTRGAVARELAKLSITAVTQGIRRAAGLV